MMEGQRNAGLYLFASLDLANASGFKYAHPDWMRLYSDSFDLIRRRLKTHQWCFWKTNGDELLFYRKLEQSDAVGGIVTRTDRTMADSLDQIHQRWTCYSDIAQLSIKTTLWIANVTDYVSDSKAHSGWNDFRMPVCGGADFLGKEMDIGFRICKYVPRAKTGLSAALAYYMIKKSPSCLKYIRLIDHVPLKGVWNNKRYPILWLFRAYSTHSIIRSFHYDERYDNELINRFMNNLLANPDYGKIEPAEFVNMLDYLGCRRDYDEVFEKNG